MSWAIRPFNPTEAEYEAAVRVRNLAEPETPTTVAIWQHGDRTRGPDSQFQRLVAVNQHGGIDGYAQLGATTSAGDSFFLNLNLFPELWNSELPETLYQEATTALKNAGATSVLCGAGEAETDKLSLLTWHGFEAVMRSPISHLSVQTFDPTPFFPVQARLEVAGIDLVQPVGGWQHDPYWQHLVHDLDWEILQDTPHHEERRQTPFAKFIAEEFDHPNFLADGYFIAFDAERPVGMTNLVRRSGTTRQLATSVTGVSRSHRRRGIATALKVQSILYAQNLGSEIIMTGNEENNPMYLLNLRLGFQAQPAWLELRKSF